MPGRIKPTNIPNIIFDETVDFGDGSKLRFVIDANTFQTLLNNYRTALLIARGIPININRQPDPASPLVQEIIKKMDYLKDSPAAIMDQAVAYYEEQHELAGNEAGILAFLANGENVFDGEPTPYEDDDVLEAPGLVVLTPPKRDLTKPVERRLKQIFDFYSANPVRQTIFIETMDRCWQKMAQYVEAASAKNGGFRS